MKAQSFFFGVKKREREGTVLGSDETEEFTVDAKAFSKMKRLRLLEIKNLRLPEGLNYLSNELRFIKWSGCPLVSFPSSFQPNKLRELNLPYSKLQQLFQRKEASTQLSFFRYKVPLPPMFMILSNFPFSVHGEVESYQPFSLGKSC